jgi:hypothetical protein
LPPRTGGVLGTGTCATQRAKIALSRQVRLDVAHPSDLPFDREIRTCIRAGELTAEKRDDPKAIGRMPYTSSWTL